jgi:hypothetical protein
VRTEDDRKKRRMKEREGGREVKRSRAGEEVRVVEQGGMGKIFSLAVLHAHTYTELPMPQESIMGMRYIEGTLLPSHRELW